VNDDLKRTYEALAHFQSHDFNALLARNRGLSIIDMYDLDELVIILRKIQQDMPEALRQDIDKAVLILIDVHHRNSVKEDLMKEAQERLKSVVDLMYHLIEEKEGRIIK